MINSSIEELFNSIENSSLYKRYKKMSDILSKDSNIKSKDVSYISLAEYLFCDSKVVKEIGLNDLLTDVDKNNLIKEDVYEKVIN